MVKMIEDLQVTKDVYKNNKKINTMIFEGIFAYKE